jgi:hypothetical protein
MSHQIHDATAISINSLPTSKRKQGIKCYLANKSAIYKEKEKKKKKKSKVMVSCLR